MADLTFLPESDANRWYRSSFCGSGACVEVRRDGEAIVVRDGNLGDDSREQVWSLGRWRNLIAALASGEDTLEVVPMEEDGGVWLGSGDSLYFTADEWNAFIAGVKAGEFDVEKLCSASSTGGYDAGQPVGVGGGSDQIAATGTGEVGASGEPVPVAAQSQPEINWALINDLATKPHPLLNIGGTCHDCPHWTGEVLQEARNVHHLLDLIKIPHGKGYANDIDARTYLAVRQILALRERLDRIQSWHSRETAEAGMVGDFCNECGEPWPCDTRRMADGTYGDSAADVPIEDAPIAVAEPRWGSGPLVEHNPETPADSRLREAADRAAGMGEADPVPETPGAGSADSYCGCVVCRAQRGDVEAKAVIDGILNGPRSEPASEETPGTGSADPDGGQR